MVRVISFALVILALLAGGANAQSPAREKAEPQAGKPSVVVNLNTASATELEQLPGIGAKVAARIVDYRTKKGPFKKVEELMNVQGIGEKSFLKLRSQLTVGAASASAAQQQ